MAITNISTTLESDRPQVPSLFKAAYDNPCGWVHVLHPKRPAPATTATTKSKLPPTFTLPNGRLFRPLRHSAAQVQLMLGNPSLPIPTAPLLPPLSTRPTTSSSSALAVHIGLEYKKPAAMFIKAAGELKAALLLGAEKEVEEGKGVVSTERKMKKILMRKKKRKETRERAKKEKADNEGMKEKERREQARKDKAKKKDEEKRRKKTETDEKKQKKGGKEGWGWKYRSGGNAGVKKRGCRGSRGKGKNAATKKQ